MKKNEKLYYFLLGTIVGAIIIIVFNTLSSGQLLQGFLNGGIT